MLCDDCQKNPATYGDGVTWKRCSECQLKHTQANPDEDKLVEFSGEGFEHVILEGLTSIIMPIHNNNYSLFHYTGNAIGSVRQHTIQPYELIVVDNGSSIQPPNLNSYYADKIIKWEENRGVTKAWNAGIRCSQGEYIVLLNNDVQVYSHWLETVKESLEKVDLVMATPMYSNTEPFARWQESQKIYETWKDKPIEETFSDFKDFSCVAFKRSLIDKIGLFDEDFFNYASDSEFLDRMQAAGSRFASCKKLAIHHIIDATGASIQETPEIMNKDKEIYAKKKQNMQNSEATTSLNDLQGPSEEKFSSDTICKYNLVRTKHTGDKIFLLEDKYHWIKTAETLVALGANFGQEKMIEFSELQQYEKGEDITMENVEKFKV